MQFYEEYRDSKTSPSRRRKSTKSYGVSVSLKPLVFFTEDGKKVGVISVTDCCASFLIRETVVIQREIWYTDGGRAVRK